MLFIEKFQHLDSKFLCFLLILNLLIIPLCVVTYFTHLNLGTFTAM